ncbi:addiction module toxin RelE/StbE family [Clostridium sp. CAG:628]|jgi:addiction module toxin, relE/stbE family|nr:addiction module toxin RelE/StbE family [Clostridium sp. CAG:628]
MTKYQIKFTSSFKKSLKKVLKQGKEFKKIKTIIVKLANKEELEIKYKNHELNDNKKFKNCKECHVEPDWLLVYKYYENDLILLLVETGSHSEIFKK